jgi:Tol biopolymer transport system component
MAPFYATHRRGTMTPERWQLIERLYHSAQARPAAERSKWLDDACGGDRDLRQSVIGLLAEPAPQDGFLITPRPGHAATTIDDSLAPLSAGRRIGAFEIESVLGAGGMGQVYRARDIRLNRMVALKVLSPILSDEHARVRFQWEALAASSLNHPNIVTVFEAGEFDGRQYLVTELVDGGTLSDWIRTRQPSWQQIIELLIGVADGLASAHDAGILHRDLKPANILVDRNGYAKLADFGLAKLIGGPVDHDRTSMPDVRTQSGVIIGTIAYMSPEQAMGDRVDQRTDLFSFGVVLYELLAGKRPFEGDTDLERLQAVVHREAEPLHRVRGDLPEALCAIVEKTLRKDRAERYQNARDLVGDLRQLVRQPAGRTPARVRTGPARRLLIVAAGLAALIVAVAVVRWFPTSPTRPPETVRLSVTLPADQALNTDGGAAPLAISPDGRRVVYAAVHDGQTQLYVRAFDAFESRALAGTDGAQYPFFSPDGRSVGFFAGGRLLRVSLAGGPPVPVCDVPVLGHGATWGPDGTIVYDPGSSGLMRVAAEGGRPEPLTSGDPLMDRRDFEWPHFLPEGDALLASTAPGQAATIVAFSFRTRQWREVTAGLQPQFVPPAYLAYHASHLREGELQVVGFDPKELKVRGAPVSFLNGAFRARTGGAAYYAIARSGTLVFAPGGLARTLVWIDRNGRRTPASDDRRGFRFPRLSPNGRYLAVTIDPRPSEIWVYDLERGSRMLLASRGLIPIWSPDGQRIAFTSAGNSDLYSQRADGSSPAEPLLEREGGQYAHSWSRDGRLLFFHDLSRPATKSDVWVLQMGGQARPVLATAVSESHPAISPDGRWLAYGSDESGRAEIYVRPFPDTNAMKWPISIGGGHSPRWSNDGRQLFYMNGQNLMAAAVRADATKITAGTPSALFNGPFDTTQDNNYDISPDGSRFLMVEASPEGAMRALQVVLNWSLELERLVSGKNIVN